MATMSPKSISFLLLITLFLSVQIHARESQFFFSKVSSLTPTTIPTTAIPTTTTTNEKEKATTIVATKQPEKEPTFIPEANNGNYGLYSQQYQEDATNTQKTLDESNTNKGNNYNYRPIVNNNNNNGYEDQQQQEEQEQQEEDKFVQTSLQDVENSGYPTNTNTESKSTNSNGYYYNTNSESKSSTDQNKYYYNTNTNTNNAEKQGMSDTRYLENGKYYYKANTNTNTESKSSSSDQNQYNNNNPEKQGMSDTRYMENGKYFYNVENEKNTYYNPNSQLQSTETTTPQGYYNNYNNNEQFTEFNAGENEQYVP